MKRNRVKAVHMGQDEIIRWLMPGDQFTGRQIWIASVSFYKDTFDIEVRRDWWWPTNPDKYTRESLAKLVAKGVLQYDVVLGYCLSDNYLEEHNRSVSGAKYAALETLRTEERHHLKAALDKLHKWNQFVYLATDKQPRYWWHNKDEFHFINWQGKLHGFPVDIQPINTKDGIEDIVRWHEQIIQWIEVEMARVAYDMDTKR